MPMTRFLAPTDSTGSQTVGPSIQDVFVDEHEDNASRFLPLLSVDASAVDPSWTGKLHFLYVQADESVSFERVGDQYRYLPSPYDYFESDMSGRRAHDGGADLVELDVPRLTAENRWDWSGFIYAAAKAAGVKVSPRSHLGPVPRWVQDDETPTDPDDEPMRFVGQISGYDFSDQVPDVDIFLFYSPKHQLITQITQMT